MNAHPLLHQLQARLVARPGRSLPAPGGRAAVALIFRPGPDLLLMRRAVREGDPWSGHMAFPGGHVDPTDADPRAAAVREVREEVGLELAREGRLLGRLDDLPTHPRTGPTLIISPFVYQLSDDPLLSPNDEVASLHWIALSRLLAGEGRTTRSWTWQGVPLELPAIRLDGTEIWGLTLMMLDALLQRVREAQRAP